MRATYPTSIPSSFSIPNRTKFSNANVRLSLSGPGEVPVESPPCRELPPYSLCISIAFYILSSNGIRLGEPSGDTGGAAVARFLLDVTLPWSVSFSFRQSSCILESQAYPNGTFNNFYQIDVRTPSCSIFHFRHVVSYRDSHFSSKMKRIPLILLARPA